MREIRFRFWNTISKEYEDNDLFFVRGDGFVCSNDCKEEHILAEQYTGLKDKNDKEIYEGDIVSEDFEFEYSGEITKTIWQVRWCDGECAFELHYVSGLEVEGYSLIADYKENYEVIGNIHENAGLLEDE